MAYWRFPYPFVWDNSGESLGSFASPSCRRDVRYHPFRQLLVAPQGDGRMVSAAENGY